MELGVRIGGTTWYGDSVLGRSLGDLLSLLFLICSTGAGEPDGGAPLIDGSAEYFGDTDLGDSCRPI